jgi:phosphatidylserine/phosphatidylglycerophosphate/cardiolipin synthase-like enzyme
MNTDDRKSLRSVLMRLIAQAGQSIVVEHGYLSDPDVTDALIEASKRSVRVTLILPEKIDFHRYANMQAVGKIMSEGDGSHVHVLMYKGVIHAKILLIDHDTAFVGSMNLMRSSIDEMGEVNVLVSGRYRALRKLREALREDILHCRALSTPPWLLWATKWLAWLGL